MRKFFLTNSAGERFNLMRFDAFFHAPDGLGFDQAISAARVGNDYLETDSYLEQHSISGEMVIQTYEIYRQFASFIAHEPLTLTYQPEETEYFIRCKVKSIGKTEIGGANRLICPITFLSLGTWFERQQTYYESEAETVKVVLTGDLLTFDIDEEAPLEAAQLNEDGSITVVYSYSTGDSKTYGYDYNYTYTDSALGGITVQNGAIESPLVLSIIGAASDPSWSLTQEGVVIATGAVTAEIPAGHRLVVDARPASMEIAEYTDDGTYVRDLYYTSDFSTARFLYAPPGESTVSVMSGGVSTSCVVEVEKYARTV